MLNKKQSEAGHGSPLIFLGFYPISIEIIHCMDIYFLHFPSYFLHLPFYMCKKRILLLPRISIPKWSFQNNTLFPNKDKCSENLFQNRVIPLVLIFPLPSSQPHSPKSTTTPIPIFYAMNPHSPFLVPFTLTLLNQIYKCVGGGTVVLDCWWVRRGGGEGSCCWSMQVIHGWEGRC